MCSSAKKNRLKNIEGSHALSTKASHVGSYIFFFWFSSGHDVCVEALLEYEEMKKFTGNKFSPLHCAV